MIPVLDSLVPLLILSDKNGPVVTPQGPFWHS